MIDFTREEMDVVRRAIERIAIVSDDFAQQAGIGGMETAGRLISYLATHPRDIEPLLRFGPFELPSDWHERGCLTWHAVNGKIVHPDHARRARTIKKMEKQSHG